MGLRFRERWWPVGGWAVVALLALAPVAARAQETQMDEATQERARSHFEAGASYYEAGSYEDALREFQRSYDLSRRPQLFYNISLCYRNIGDLEQSLSYLRRYAEEVPDIENREVIEQRIANLERRIAAHAEGGEEGPAEAAAAPSSSPEARSSAEGAPAPAPSGDGGANVGAIVGFSVAAAGLVLAGIFGGLTLAEDGALADECSPRCSAEQVSDLRTFAAVTDVGFGVAAAGAVVGLVFLIVGTSGGASETAQVAPWASDRAAGLVVRGRL